MSLLIASQIKKSYGSLQVLKGVDLQIEKGEMVSIVGASGAGKSTLLHIIGSLDKADSGTISINGEYINRKSDTELSLFRNHYLGFIFQFHNLLPEFTAIENVCIPGYIQKQSASKLKQRATQLLTSLGLADRIHHQPSELSGGEQQRVAVARALINEPAIIFADEPSGNLDSTNAEELHSLFYELSKQTGQTFVIVTHNNHLADMADRKLVMKDGLMLA